MVAKLMLLLVVGVGSVCLADESGETKIGKGNRTFQMTEVYDLGRPRPKFNYGGEVLHPKIPKTPFKYERLA